MDKDNYFLKKSSLEKSFITEKFVKYENNPNLGKTSYYKNDEINELDKLVENLKLGKNIKPQEIIADAKKLYNKIAPKKTVFIQGIPIEVPLRGNQHKSLMAASIYTIINNSKNNCFSN